MLRVKLQFITVIGLAMFCLYAISSSADGATVRDAVWAGKFYPAGGEALSASIDNYTRKAQETKIHTPPGKQLKALILPHAGYVYSGVTAAHASLVLGNSRYKKVILLGPDHRVGFSGGATSSASSYATPLGEVPLHREAIESLEKSPYFKANPASDLSEHSLEVIVPFLQKYLSSFELVPVVVGQGPLQPMLEGIQNVLEDQTLLVSSSDLSHYLPYDQAVIKDKETIQMILDLDGNRLLTTGNTACGGRPISIALAMAQKFGWQPTLLHYSNSGDTAGTKDKVVGYAAIAFWGDESMGEKRSDQMTDTQGQSLCRLARHTIMHRLGESLPEVQVRLNEKDLADEQFNEKRGVFVTLTREGRLRGCIGSLSGFESIRDGVRRNALNAAFNDHRFTPLTVDELGLIDIEVSILSEPEPLAYEDADDLVSKLKPGIDGVILQKGSHSATFLPQVWDQLPKTADFLSQLALKAGLSPDAWRKGNLEVKTYQVQYFHEEK